VAGAFAVAASMLVGRAVAQVPGPVIVAPRPELEPFSFELLEVALEADWRREVDKVEPAGGPTDEDVEDRFREILELAGIGFIGHPNLFKLDLRGRFWLTQRRLDLETTQRTEHVDEFLWNYDVTGLLLEKQKLPVTVYTRRTDSDIDRQFGGTLTNTFTETGVRVNFRDETFPSALEVFRREQEQEDRFEDVDFDTEQNTIQADGLARLGPHQTLSWDYAYDDVDETGTGRIDRSFLRSEGNVSHSIGFGQNAQHRLRSALRLFDQSGDIEFRQVRLHETLRFRHSDRLNSRFSLVAERVDRPDVEQRRLDGEAFFQHQLFDSLTSTAIFGGNRADIPTDDFESDEVFGELAFDYSKRVPLGTFLATTGGRLSRLRESDRGQPVPVVDRVFTFSPSGLIIIDEQNVEPDSIVITDLTGLIFYTEGDDYTLLALPDRVEIRRRLGGDIVDQQTVLIDYDIGPQPGGKTTTTGVGLDFRYNFDEGPLRGLSVYTTYRRQDEDLSTALVEEEITENDFTDLIYGLEYDIGRLYLKAERQDRDSSLSPFDATRLEGRYIERFGPGAVLAFRAFYEEIDRNDVDIRTRTTTLSGQWSQRVTDRLSANLLVTWQNIDDNQDFDLQAFEQELDLTWRYRQTEVFAKIRNSFRDGKDDDTTFQTFQVGFRREF
jgi:hypothetical protein